MSEKESSTSSGQEIPPVEKSMDQDKINAFAHFSGDFNPIHINEDFAKKAGLGGTIAHGAISLGYFCEMLVNYFGEDWLEGGGFSVSFISPVRPGYKVKYCGVITGERETDKGKVLDLEIWCENQDGQKCIVGKAYGPAKL